MKKTVVMILILLLALAVAASAAGVTVAVNGSPIPTVDANGAVAEPFIEDGTTYVPVRAVATALNVAVDWDNDARTVILGERGEAAPELGENVNVFINGKKFNPTDANGKAVHPLIKDGTTYLPVRAIAQAFARKVSWDGASSTVLIEDTARVDGGKTYKIVLSGTESVIAPSGDGSGSALVTELFTGDERQLWRFVPVVGEDGFYQIVNAASGCAMDVNVASRSAGAKILQYNVGDGENQKFMLYALEDGAYKIVSKNSVLPVEASAGEVKQNIDRNSPVQSWLLIPDEAVSKEPVAKTYKTLSTKDGSALTYSEGGNDLAAERLTDAETQQWELVPNAGGFYYIQTKNGGKSIDVANNSTTDGDPLITYDHSGDDNQRWIFEKQDDGAYKIMSVHSGLYIKVKDGGVVHSADGDEFIIGDIK